MNIGPLEIVIVLALALLVFGPKQLPQMGRTLGRGVREFRHAADTARTELGLDDISAELGKVKSGIDGLKADVDVKGAIVGPPPATAPPTPGLTRPAVPDSTASAPEAPTSEAPATDVVAPKAPASEAVTPKAPEAPATGDDGQPSTPVAPGS